MSTTLSSSTTTAHRLTAIAPRVAALGTACTALMLVALHAVKPELDPSWRFLSEYATGQSGWVMKLAFLVWAASCAALAIALAGAVRTRPGRTGVVVLAIVAAALVLAGIFPQDPLTAGPDEHTIAGTIHAIASMIGIPGIPVAAMLITSSLRRSGSSRWNHRTVTWTAHATWISLAAMAAYLVWSVPRAGGFNAEVWAGWMNRLVVATYLAWQLLVACRLGERGRVPVALHEG